MRNKYSNIKTVIDGITFDSRKESVRYGELKLLEKAGVIKDLVLQPRFELQEGFNDKRGKHHRAITYIADFQFYDVKRKETIVEDVKGMRTQLYVQKMKLLLYKYPNINFYEL